jgi:hypothetical protein
MENALHRVLIMNQKGYCHKALQNRPPPPSVRADDTVQGQRDSVLLLTNKHLYADGDS